MPENNKNKSEILKLSLKKLRLHGWSDELLEEVSYELYKDHHKAEIIFGSVKNLVDYYLQDIDNKMLEKLKKLDPKKLKIRECIKQAILIRINLLKQDHVKETLKFFANPLNADLGLSSLMRTCDHIWHFAGDKSTDFNYYTKRILLSGVYSSTLLYYLKEPDPKKIEEFVADRIDNVLTIGKFKQNVNEFLTDKFNC